MQSIKAGLVLLSLFVNTLLMGATNGLVINSVNIEKTNLIKIRLKTGQSLIGNRKIIKENNNANSKDTKIVYEFLGLPYAQAPINEKRFQFAYTLNSIFNESSYDATYARASCIQVPDTTLEETEIWNPPGNISEDCLYMNIWVPVTKAQDHILSQESSGQTYIEDGFLKDNSNKATIFWVYGGSWNSGSASLKLYDGALMAGLENVIVASANYRLGPFGFLYLNRTEAPGNAALSDKVKSIEWYRQHYLELFGGSPKDLTLFGESSGAMSLHYLLLSKKNQLFNRVIFQSVSAYTDTAYKTPEVSFLSTKEFAKKVGCLSSFNKTAELLNLESQVNPLKIQLNQLKYENFSTYDNTLVGDQILKCLLTTEANILALKQFELSHVNNYLKMGFVPTLDFHKLVESDPTKFDFNTNREIQHEVLVGNNQNEGTFFEFYLYFTKYFNTTHFFDTNVTRGNEFARKIAAESLRTTTFNYETLTAEEKVKDDESYGNFIGCLNDLYSINGKFVGLNNIVTKSGDDFNLDSAQNRIKKSSVQAQLLWEKISKIAGDYAFTCPLIKFANRYSENKNKKTFVYHFNKRSTKNQLPKWFGATHGYEIEYIFGMPLSSPDLYDNDDRLISRNMISYWANFAKTGKLYSKFDSKYQNQERTSFVDFSIASFNTKNLSEEDEINYYNKLNINCELWNQFEAETSNEQKLQFCQAFTAKFNSAIFFSYSKTLIILLLCFVPVFF